MQIVLKDGSAGRTYTFTNGEVTSKAGIHPNPEVTMLFKDIDTALTFLTPGVTQAEIIHAAKNFRVMVLGPDASVVWFMQLRNLTQTAALEQGIPIKQHLFCKFRFWFWVCCAIASGQGFMFR